MGVCHSKNAPSAEIISAHPSSSSSAVPVTTVAADPPPTQFSIDSDVFRRKGIHYQLKCVASSPLEMRHPPLNPCGGEFICCYSPEWLPHLNTYREPTANLILHRFQFDQKGKLKRVNQTKAKSGIVWIKWINSTHADLPSATVGLSATAAASVATRMELEATDKPINSVGDLTIEHEDQQGSRVDEVEAKTEVSLTDVSAEIPLAEVRPLTLSVPSSSTATSGSTSARVEQEFVIKLGPNLPVGIFSTQQLGPSPMPVRLSLYAPWQVAGTPEYVAHETEYHHVRPNLLERFGEHQASHLDELLVRMRRQPVLVLHPEEVDRWPSTGSYDRDKKDEKVKQKSMDGVLSEEVHQTLRQSICDFNKLQQLTLIMPDSNVENVFRR